MVWVPQPECHTPPVGAGLGQGPAETFDAKDRQRGFTLLEALIALLVLSIGLLGLAALQTVGLRSSHGALLSSQAALLAHDMADRLRAAHRLDGHLRDNGLPGLDLTSLLTPLADPAPECDGAQVLAGGMDGDVEEWLNALACHLPAGNGSVARDGDDHVITVEWIDPQAAQLGLDRWTFTLRIRP